MENFPLLRDIAVLMAVAVPVIILVTKAGLPTMVGFLATGVIIGPYGFGLVTEIGTVEKLSQIGVVLLLFTIGIEFSVSRMLDIRREGALGGGLQVALTVAVAFAAALALGNALTVSLLLGFIVSLSSTAIVLKLLTDKGEVSSPHGNLSVGVLLFQDICVVLMVMVIQSMGGDNAGGALGVLKGLGFSVGVFALIVAAVMYLIPRLFGQVVKLRSREVFILTIVLVCLGTAWVTSLLGLSLALGAFVAGLAISESEYSSQITAEVIPFRDTFSSLFFISIGMLLDFNYFIAHAASVILLVAAIIALKSLVLSGVGLVLGYPLRLSVVAGINLAQIGEFSFILIRLGEDYGLIGADIYQTLIAASIATMALTPLLYRLSSRFSSYVAGLGRAEPIGPFRKSAASNHVVIIGYGLNGRNLARVLKETAIAHLVVDVNMDRVREAKAAGHDAFYGDSTHPEILKKMGVDKAKTVAIAISDPISARMIVRNARDLNPAVSILVRTRYIREVEDLYRLGANQVIPEEFETSVEIFARVLRDFRVPGNVIQNQIDLIRQEGYAMLRSPSMAAERLSPLTSVLEKSVTDTYYVDAGCGVAGKTLEGLDLRKKTGVTVIAVVRKGEARTNPGADYAIEAGDILVLLGSHAELAKAMDALSDRCPA